MQTPVLVMLASVLIPTALLAQVPRDTPSPAIQNASRERDLRALVASGDATRETYIELAYLDIMQNRFDDALTALHDAAQLETTVPEAQHTLATITWEHANRDITDPAVRMVFIREGIALENRALALKPDYADAMIWKQVLLRMQANLTSDSAEKARLIADADALRYRVIEMQGQQLLPAGDAPASFSGFRESFDETHARLTPLRVGRSLRQPIKTHDARPAYPAAAQMEHVQGVVIIEAIIDPSGAVANARILRSIPALDEAALSAVSLWQFTPTLVNGAPVAVLMTVTVNFTLQAFSEGSD